MTILRSAKDISAATTADLVETYNAMTGASIKKFENRAIAERRVEMALLAATDRAGHAGVQPNTTPTPKTMQELPHPYPAGSLRAQLSEEIAAQKPVVARPKASELAAAGAPAAPRAVITAVRATFTGTSRCQPNSIRANVLAAIQSAPDHTITIADLDKHFGHPTRGYVQKLLEKAHLTIVEGAV